MKNHRWSKADQEAYNSAIRWPYDIVWRKLSDDDGGGYIAYHPEFGECACSYADNTLRQALRGLPLVRRFVLEVMTSDDSQYPDPIAFDEKRKQRRIINEADWHMAVAYVRDRLKDVNTGKASVKLTNRGHQTLCVYSICRDNYPECFISVFDDCCYFDYIQEVEFNNIKVPYCWLDGKHPDIVDWKPVTRVIKNFKRKADNAFDYNQKYLLLHRK